MLKTTLLAFVAAICLSLLAGTAFALPGDAAPPYGNNGVLTSLISAGTDQAIEDFELDEQDRAVAIVRSEPGSISRLARIDADGKLDPSFGTAGFVEASGVSWSGVALDPQGRILVSGHQGTEALLSRFLPNGDPDPAFAESGTWRTDLLPLAGDGVPQEGLHLDMYAVRSLNNGMVAFGGDTAKCGYDYSDYQDVQEDFYCPGQVVIRLSDTGEIVPSFGNAGVRFSSLPDLDSTVALLADGRAVIFGGYTTDSSDGGMDSVIALRMLDSAGKNLFAPLPRGATYDVGLQGSRGAAEMDGEGRLLIAAGTQIYRIGALGGLDPSFDGNGVINLSRASWEEYGGGNLQVADIVADSKGRILISGGRGSRDLVNGKRTPMRSGFAARLRENGQADPTFSNDGLAVAWSGRPNKAARQFGRSNATLEIDGSGRIMVAGSVPTAAGVRGAIARLQNGDRAVPSCMGQRPTYIGTPGPDVVGGRGIGGVVYTGGGDDVVESAYLGKVCTGPGDDRVTLRHGSTVELGDGDDVVTATARSTGQDLIFAQGGDDEISTGAGNDRIYGGKGDDRLDGETGDDRLTGQAGRDHLIGGEGNDTLRGSGGQDRLDPGPAARVERVYRDWRGSFRIKLMRFRDRVVFSTISYRLACEDGESYRSSQTGREEIELKGPTRRFEYSDSADEDWFAYSTVLKGHQSGSDLVGKFKYYDFSDGRCWTGESRQVQWLKFRAEPQPLVRQSARQ